MHNKKLIPFSLSLISFILLIRPFQLCGQELNVKVNVDYSKIKSTSLNYLDHFSKEIEAYLNGYSWTNDKFRPKERILAQIQIFLTDVTDNYTFTAHLIIRSTRPVYNTARLTTLFLYNDDEWVFQYIPNRSLRHDELQFDAIATMLNFYAYLILGYDYDSFEKLGGTPWFTEAQNQVSVAQAGGAAGWKRSSRNTNNRAQLISSLTAANYELFRKAFYQYHRRGLDLFIKAPKQARQNILEAL